MLGAPGVAPPGSPAPLRGQALELRLPEEWLLELGLLAALLPALLSPSAPGVPPSLPDLRGIAFGRALREWHDLLRLREALLVGSPGVPLVGGGGSEATVVVSPLTVRCSLGSWGGTIAGCMYITGNAGGREVVQAAQPSRHAGGGSGGPRGQQPWTGTIGGGPGKCCQCGAGGTC